MSFQGSDIFAISRAGTNYKCTGSEVLAFVQANVGTGEYRVADIAARNALNGQMTLGDRVVVDDATGDATVGVGWAIYVWLSSNTWRKTNEQEGLDVVIGGTNLGYTAGAGSGIITSDSGNDANLPAVTNIEAGLSLPAHKIKLDFVSVSAATDLDAMRAASHAAVSTAGTANNNPIVVAGQALSFNVANLTAAP
jgi:hypothetical protein